MAVKKKPAAAENVEITETPENVENVEKMVAAGKFLKRENMNDRLTLDIVAETVNAVVDLVFVERNGKTEFAAEYYEVLSAYFKIGAFYPETHVFDDGLSSFFLDYIDGKYSKQLKALEDNITARYIDNAVRKKIEAKMKQIENPLINSLVKFVDYAAALAEKYIKDIDNVGSSDIKKFISDFANFSKNVNTQTVTDAVMQKHLEDLMQNGAVSSPKQTKPAVRKQSAKTNKTEV